MIKKWAILSMAFCIGVGTTWAPLYAFPRIGMQKETEQEVKADYPIDMDTPITTAEFIIAILDALGEAHPVPMDTHYALSAMEKAAEKGWIDLEAYPMATWSQEISKKDKQAILDKLFEDEAVEKEKVMELLSQLMVTQVDVDGQPVDLQGLPIKHYNGHLMLPLRPVAEAMGFTVSWDPTTYTAILSNGQIQSPVQIGFDSYFYSSIHAIGMSAPFSVGASPMLIDGWTYVPAQYFSMFADSKVADGTLYYTLK